MQVKKFEAPTMKEALEMVKIQLGPDAVILNAKDNSKGFGLLGRQSIEITAAISERQLLKKQWAESRLKEDDLAKLRARPAKAQKEFIQKSVNRYLRSEGTENISEVKTPASPQPMNKPRLATKVRYIDIDDEGGVPVEDIRQTTGKRVEDVLKEIGNAKEFVSTNNASVSQERVREAARQALNVFENSNIDRKSHLATAKSNQKVAIHNTATLNEMQNLKNEIDQLKSLLTKMQIKETFIQNEQLSTSVTADNEIQNVYNKLTQNGLNSEIVKEYLDQAQKDLQSNYLKKQSLIEGYVAKKLLNDIQITDSNFSAPVHIFVGPAGSGKSSQLVKMASDYVLNKNKKVGILTLDTEKVGAIEQLRIYSQILNIPFGIIRRPEDWVSVKDALQSLDYIFIDFPSNSLRDMNEIDRFRKMLPPETIACQRHFVLSATFKDIDASEMAERYKLAKPTDIIFSKLDEATTHGLIYNISRKMNLPLHSFGIGHVLPEDFEYATKERVVDLIFKITKLKAANERRFE